MSRVTMTALRPFLYGGRRLSPGDTFQPTRSDARVLRGIKKAAYLTTAVTAIDAAKPEPPAGTLHQPAVPVVEPPDESPEPVPAEVDAAPEAPAAESAAAGRRRSTSRATRTPRAARTYQTREIVAEPASVAESESAEDEPV